jgi:hypothetical protein
MAHSPVYVVVLPERLPDAELNAWNERELMANCAQQISPGVSVSDKTQLVFWPVVVEHQLLHQIHVLCMLKARSRALCAAL